MSEIEKNTILLGITGSISAYKMADVASALTKQGYNVETIITENGQKIINPIVFSALTGNKCQTQSFNTESDDAIVHITLANKADLLMIAPASANIIGKIANGIADDLLSTTVLACDCPKLIAPAMNSKMFENKVVQDNLEKLSRYGWIIIEPDSGILACKEEGKGKLPKPEKLLEYIYKHVQKNQDLKDKNILITAGPTQEKIDSVRYITNHSSGKMGYALAEAAACRGANVTLVSGPTELDEFIGVNKVDIVSAEDMFDEVTKRFKNQDIIIKAAAVADFTPRVKKDKKIKKNSFSKTIELEETKDILKELGKIKGDNQYLCGFSMETENLLENSKKKLKSKNVDLICANSIKDSGSGFRTDTNKVTLITKDEIIPLEKLSKLETANKILDQIVKMEET